MKRPTVGAMLLGLIPLIGACLSVSLWDRIYPVIFGIPFNFFWLILWLLLTPLCMLGAYKLEESRTSEADQDGQN